MSPVSFPVTDAHCEEIRLRRRQVRARPDVNGIDYVEVDRVRESTATPGARTAIVILRLLKGARVDQANVEITGLTVNWIKPVPEPEEGTRLPAIYRLPTRGAGVERTSAESPGVAVGRDRPQEEGAHPPKTYRLSVKGPIGRESHHLKLHATGEPGEVLPGFDPLLSEAEFSLDVDQETDRDLPTPSPCPPPWLDEPDMDYLAKDYAGFRQLVLDRLALIMPEWRERHEADLGITLVELLAYVGDHLSYYQDAVATEAYLGTARQRISVRRHARLVDYRLHEGCNARALLCLTVEAADPTIDLGNVYFISDAHLTLPLPGIISRESALAELKAAGRHQRYEVFEPVATGTADLYHAHNRIDFYTWGERECCLPRGATRAALRDGPPLPAKPEDPGDHKPDPEAQDAATPARRPPAEAGQEERLREQLDQRRELKLQRGDLLIFEEVLDPGTGLPEDADPAHRHAVRLTAVRRAYDLTNRQAVLEVEWSQADALPFPLCLSAVSNDCQYLEAVSVARGNVIPVDHGRRVHEPLDDVTAATPQRTCDECGEVQIPGARRYNPRLSRKHVVYREALQLSAPVQGFLRRRDPREAAPQVTLCGRDPQSGETNGWQPRHDLFASGGDDRHFVVEVDDERVAHLRFGDDELGEAPQPGTEFTAHYRVGEPPAGNVGAEAIRRLIVRQGMIDGVAAVRNPLEAAGGTAPETVADAKLRAPYAYRQRLLRAITADDCARLVEQHFAGQVQRAFATLTASEAQPGRYDVRVWFDALTGAEVTAGEIAGYLYPYRRIGHDLTVAPAQLVPLSVSITVAVEPPATSERVKEALEASLGSRGFFCPNRLTFETGISLSEIVATAQRIPGVAHVSELVVSSGAVTATWPGATGQGDDLMTLGPGQIPSLGKLAVTCEQREQTHE